MHGYCRICIVLFYTIAVCNTVVEAGTPLTNIHGISYEQCVDECDARGACTSANYVRRTLLCELITALGDGDIKRNLTPGHVHYRKSNISQKYNKCSCSNQEKCFLFASGMTSCSIVECGAPPYSVTMTTSNGNRNSIGAKSTVSCISKWRASGDKTIQTFPIKCGPTGVWDGLDERKCGKVVYRQKHGNINGYGAWIGRGEFYNDAVCDGMADGTTDCRIPFRDNDIDQWEVLNISRVLLSVYKNEAEVQYILFDGSESTLLSWFTQNRIISSSWVDIKTAPIDHFSITGIVRKGDNCSNRRRFYISAHHDDHCLGDAGWFTWTRPFTRDGCCAWEEPESVADILYSTATTLCVFEQTKCVGRADYFSVVIFI